MLVASLFEIVHNAIRTGPAFHGLPGIFPLVSVRSGNSLALDEFFEICTQYKLWQALRPILRQEQNQKFQAGQKKKEGTEKNENSEPAEVFLKTYEETNTSKKEQRKNTYRQE